MTVPYVSMDQSLESRPRMKRYKVVCNVGVGDVLGQTIIWFFLTLFTLGLAAPLFVYAFVLLFIQNTEIWEIPRDAK
jgi:hypothetical protein